ncbi:MAG TPA: YbfB/YjiJ family MFS transporter, partial [Candidatus Acidoferrum sp.]|nr:YbfB/YjiJ family MFS transporter [Candidatus Acidoferrum sp.]
MNKFVASGIVMLAVAMGVGRFAYTPLIPMMEHDVGLSVAMAGALATSNLFGYFVGASFAMHPITHGMRLAIVRWSLVGVVITTALMGGPEQTWLALRFVTGICSGFVLVFASSIVLERAAEEHQPSWPPLFFSGVGLGIAFSGVAVPALAGYGANAAWIG